MQGNMLAGSEPNSARDSHESAVESLANNISYTKQVQPTMLHAKKTQNSNHCPYSASISYKYHP
jgi:hypothetical protein